MLITTRWNIIIIYEKKNIKELQHISRELFCRCLYTRVNSNKCKMKRESKLRSNEKKTTPIIPFLVFLAEIYVQWYKNVGKNMSMNKMRACVCSCSRFLNMLKTHIFNHEEKRKDEDQILNEVPHTRGHTDIKYKRNILQ